MGVCKHVSTLLWHLFDLQKAGHRFVPDTLACTDKARTWGRGSTKRVTSAEFQNLQFVRHDPDHPIKGARKAHSGRDIPEPELKMLHTDLVESKICPMLVSILEECNFTPAKVMTSSSQATPATITSDNLDNIRLLIKELWAEESFEYVSCAARHITLLEAHELEKKTRGQSSMGLWHAERENKVTASKFGSVIKRKAPVTSKFLKDIFGSKSGCTRQMREGLENEDAALSRYMRKANVEVRRVGLCVNPGIPLLGASPDGVVWEHATKQYGLVEVKTLVKAIENCVETFDEVLEKKMATYLQHGKLAKTHNYHYQVQGQMAITGLKWCDFVIDWKKDCHVERVIFDEDLWKNDMLPALLNFYRSHIMSQPPH